MNFIPDAANYECKAYWSYRIVLPVIEHKYPCLILKRIVELNQEILIVSKEDFYAHNV